LIKKSSGSRFELIIGVAGSAAATMQHLEQLRA
jgi:hypothetical protein